MTKRRSWLSRQPRWAQAIFRTITTPPREGAPPLYSPRTARSKIRELISAPARDFKAKGGQAFLKGDRSKHPLSLSERQLRIKRSGGITPEAQAAGAVRPEGTYKSEKTRIAAGRLRKTLMRPYLEGLATEQRAKAAGLDQVESYNGSHYRATRVNRALYEANRAQWLRGEFLEWGDYFNLVDFALSTNDPIARVLRTSPKTRPQVLPTTLAAE